MGRGKYDTCENCTHYDERRGICLLDRTEVCGSNTIHIIFFILYKIR